MGSRSWILPLVAAAAVSQLGCSGQDQVPAGAATRDAGTVVLEDAAFPYVIEGAGLPCLVIGSSLYYPRTFSDRFKAELRCVYLDQRGFVAGSAPRSDGRLGIPGVVADIEDARQALGLDQFVLIGHSIHGLIALEYARQYPQHLSHVIAIGGPPEFTSRFTTSIQPFWDLHASAGRRSARETNWAGITPDSLTALSPSEAFITTYVANAADYWADSTYDGRWLWDGIELDMARVSELFDVDRPFSLGDSPHPNDTPVFVALGRLDFAVPYTAWDDFRGPFRDVSIHIFDRSGHTPQLEEPAEFDQRVLSWLAR